MPIDLLFKVDDEKGDFGMTSRIPTAAEAIVSHLEGLGFKRYSDLRDKQKFPCTIAELMCPDDKHHATVRFAGMNVIVTMDYEEDKMTDELSFYLRSMEEIAKELELDPHR